MSLRRRNALISSVIWIIVLVVLVIFCLPGNGTNLLEDEGLGKLIGGIALLLGLTVHFCLLFNNKKEIIDERTRKIIGKSLNVTAMGSMIYVFVFSFVIYELNSGMEVSVDWFWFLGFSSIAVFYVIGGLSYFIVEGIGIGYDS